MTSTPAKPQETALFYGNSSTQSVVSQPQLTETQQFLRLTLSAETTTLLPTEQLAEVLTISIEQIAPMPGMSPPIMGTYNWRGNILWLVDLGYLVGFKPMYQQVSASTYTAAVLQFSAPQDGKDSETTPPIGLIVNHVGNIERCDSRSIQPISLSSDDTLLAQFLQGYWFKSEQELLAILNPDSILEKIS